MRIKIVKTCHVDFIKRTPGMLVQTEDAVGAQLIELGYAAPITVEPLETASLASAKVETPEPESNVPKRTTRR